MRRCDTRVAAATPAFWHRIARPTRDRAAA